MGIQIDSGITIGAGITISPGPSAMRALLSPTGQAAYDAASSGNWFEVSSTDYGAVYSGLIDMSKIGMSDAQMAENGASWTNNYLTTVPQANATVASGSYIIGCQFKFSGGGTNTARYYSGTTFKGTFTKLANDMTATGAGTKYFLRKTPSAEGATTYIGLLGAGPASLVGSTTSWTNGGYTQSPFTTWTNYTGTFPVFQTLTTTTAQW